MTGHGGNIHEASRKTGIPPERILDFSASINPLGLPKPATAAILKGMRLLPHYPEPNAGSLTACIARHYDLAPESLLCGNGSTELIYLIPRVLRPKKVLITAPAFSEYERACTRSRKSEVTCQKLTREDNFAIDPDSFIRSMRDCNMAFLCNPNNPTGRLLGKKAVLKIAGAARRRRCYLVVDEAFMDFCPDETVMQYVRRNPYLIVLRSLTKFYALAGLRIGFGIFPLKVAQEMKKYKEPWTINSLADAAARAALQDSGYRAKSLATMQREKRFIEKSLRQAGISFVPSEANYYLIRISNASAVIRTLTRKGILVRDCSNFAGLDEAYIRIAVRSRRENAILMKELSAICAGS